MKRLEEKVCVVTGANGGIGAAVSQGFLKEGAKVVMTEFRTKGAADTARQTGISEENWMVHPLDASKKESVDRLISATLEPFWQNRCFCSACCSNNRYVRAFFFDVTEDEFDYLITNNCKKCFVCAGQAAAKAMCQHGGGVIITHRIHRQRDWRRNSVIYGANKGLRAIHDAWNGV
jgi:NAD(P)-dependent dehydrogenase (short-subunit alcohol dehydrogenase family)